MINYSLLEKYEGKSMAARLEVPGEISGGKIYAGLALITTKDKLILTDIHTEEEWFCYKIAIKEIKEYDCKDGFDIVMNKSIVSLWVT